MIARFSAMALAIATLSAGNAAVAADYRPFTAADFAAAQAAGKPIVVDVFATWCPVCKAQDQVVRQLSEAPKFKNLVIFKLNFDTQKTDWRNFKVTRQSTLIAFRGKRETSRSIAETDPDALRRVLESTAG